MGTQPADKKRHTCDLDVHIGESMLGSTTLRALLDDRILPALQTLQPAHERPAVRGYQPPQRRALPYRRIVTQATLLWLATRAVYVVLTWYAAAFSVGARAPHRSFAPDKLLTMWNRYDATWYMSVVTHGYQDPRQAAFFPLYPALTAALTPLIGGAAHRIAAAMIVSNLGALAAFVGLGLLATHEDSAAAGPSIRALAAYPLSLFTVAGYADSLLLALAIFALYFARRDRWGLAALCAFLAGLTRPTAIFLVLPLAWEYGAQHGIWQALRERRGRLLWSRVCGRTIPAWLAAVCAVPAALGLYAVFLWQRFGDPMEFATVQSVDWHRQTTVPWLTVGLQIQNIRQMAPWSWEQARTLIDFAPILLFAVLTIFVARRLPFAYTLYMLGVLFTALSEPVLGSGDMVNAAGRYMLPSVPIFLLLGMWAKRRPWLDELVVAGGFALQAVLIGYWFAGGWLV